MQKLILINFFLFALLSSVTLRVEAQFDNAAITVGAERMEQYLPLLQNQQVALVVNQTSVVGEKHLVDALIAEGVEVVKIFAPEHGFRGTADAGESVKNGIDVKTGRPIVSLYGKNKKPNADQLRGIDIVIFDIQDVGARFYTYISTMHYVMEACAEQDKKVLILDRPNPNGHYVDGPILDPAFKSFVGMHPIPIVHGLTVGELACMINEEGWLKDGLNCNVEVIPCLGYSHQSFYQLPIKPSPNLPNMESVYLYPSLCFFEGTIVSVGRGTDHPFQMIGHPKIGTNSGTGDHVFRPAPKPGAKYPKLEGQTCYGTFLGNSTWSDFQNMSELNIDWFHDYHNILQKNTSEPFFLKTLFIDKLAGTDQLRKDLLAGKTVNEIRQAWQKDLEAYKQMRKKYLLYPDFE